MSEILRDTIVRFAAVFVCVLAIALVILGRIIYLQTSDKEQARCDEVLAWQVRANQPILPIRGTITDTQGRLLASSMPQYYVNMDTRVEFLHQKGDSIYKIYADSVAEGLSRIIGDQSAKEYRKAMDEAYYNKDAKKRDFRICRQSINYIQKKQIERLPLVKRGRYKSGFYYTPLYRRNHPYGDLGKRTIGNIFGEANKGIYGIESYCDSYLQGEAGYATRQMVAGRWENVPVQDARNGYTVVSTLDANLLDICDKTLRQRLQLTQADWGCCILMEVKTGVIRAICNLDREADGSYSELMNHAAIRVEPGSTFKTISLMAVLDDEKVQITDTFRVYKKGWQYLSSTHTDSHPKDTFYTVRSSLAVSSNIAFAKIVTESYEKKAAKFVDKLEKMGLTKEFTIEIPGATPPRIDIPNDAVTLSKMAYGYSVELSPIQLIAFYNSIANGGRMVRPRLLERIEQDGETVKEWHTEILKANICKQSVLRDVQSALHDVVWDNKLGTASVNPWGGRKAQSDIVHIAGKTGTAQLFHHGRYHKDEHRMTFIGYFPEEAPEYTCLCMIEHPRNKGAYDAGMDCGSVVRQIAEKTMAYTGEYHWADTTWVWRKK